MRKPTRDRRRTSVERPSVARRGAFGWPHDDGDVRLAPAYTAFLAGKLSSCARLCRAAALGGDSNLRVDATILAARALIRLGRNGDALTMIAKLEIAADDPRRNIARVLEGTASLRLGDRNGAPLLQSIAELSLEHPAAFEAAFELLRNDCLTGDYATARKRVFALPVRYDFCGARTLEAAGYVAFYENRHQDAVDAFQSALEMLQTLGLVDEMLIANVAYAIALIAVDRIDEKSWSLAQSWAQRCSYLKRSSSHAYQLHGIASAWHELRGRPIEALESVRAAEACLRSPLARLIARCRRAAILFRYGERLGCAEVCSSIRKELSALDTERELFGVNDDFAGLVAETLAMLGDRDGAADALSRRLPPERSPLRFSDPTHIAREYSIQSLLADVSGKTLTARHLLEQAFTAWQRVGNRRRALLTALRLLEVAPHEAAAAYAERLTRTLPPESWARIAFVNLSQHPPGADSIALNRAQRDVLDMLVRGMSTSEIAKARGRSEGTTRNTVSDLLRVFGVSNRQALLAEYARSRMPGREVDAEGHGASERPVADRSSDAAFSELQKQANDAIWVHHALVSMLKRTVETGISSVDTESLSDTQACPIGAWLARDASKAFGGSALYEATVKAHERFHCEATRVVEIALAGDKLKARADMSRGGRFFDAAARMRAALHAWADLAQP